VVIKPTQPELTAAQEALVIEFTDAVREWAGELEPVRRPTVFYTLGRDRFGVISDPLRHTLWQSDRFDLKDMGVVERVLRVIEWTRPTVGARKEALESARWRGADYVIWGHIEEFADLGGAAVLRARLELTEQATGKPLQEKTFELTKGSGSILTPITQAAAQSGIHAWSPLSRLLLWVIFTLLLPLFAYPITRKVVLGDSNAAILALLITYVLASVLAAYVVLLRSGDGWMAAFMLLIVFSLALAYMYKALTAIKEFHD